MGKKTRIAELERKRLELEGIMARKDGSVKDLLEECSRTYGGERQMLNLSDLASVFAKLHEKVVSMTAANVELTHQRDTLLVSERALHTRHKRSQESIAALQSGLHTLSEYSQGQDMAARALQAQYTSDKYLADIRRSVQEGLIPFASVPSFQRSSSSAMRELCGQQHLEERASLSYRLEQENDQLKSRLRALYSHQRKLGDAVVARDAAIEKLEESIAKRDVEITAHQQTHITLQRCVDRYDGVASHPPARRNTMCGDDDSFSEWRKQVSSLSPSPGSNFARGQGAEESNSDTSHSCFGDTSSIVGGEHMSGLSDHDEADSDSQ